MDRRAGEGVSQKGQQKERLALHDKRKMLTRGAPSGRP